MDEGAPVRILPVVIGITLTCVLLALLAYLAQKRRTDEGAIPQLTLIAPANDEVTDSPLVVRFASTVPVTLGPAGWGSGTLHLHAWVNDIAYMPAAGDIHPDSGGSYTWRLDAVPRGIVAIRLGWADASHGPVSGGTSQTLTSVVR